MEGVLVLTGATNGLGLSCARALARAGTSGCGISHLVLACRGVEAARKVADSIQSAAFPRDRIVVLDQPCDLASLASVRAYAAALRAWLGDRKVSVLTNNAGIGGSPTFSRSADGFEVIWATNHLGHFLLTLLLLPAFAPSGGRIVNVASEVHDIKGNKIPMPDPEEEWPATTAEYDEVLARGRPINGENTRDAGQRYYTRSKLCNVILTHELARRLSGAAPRECAEATASKLAAVAGARSCSLPAATKTKVVSFNPGLMLDGTFVSASQGAFIGGLAWLLQPVLSLTPLGKVLRSNAISGPVLARVSLPGAPALGGLPEAGAADATAAYFDGERLHAASAFSRSAEVATRSQQELWEHSLRWAGVTEAELKDAGFA